MSRLRQRLRRGWGGQRYRGQRSLLLTFVLLAAVYGVVSGTYEAWFPAASAVLLIMLAGYVMQLRYLLLFYLVLIPAVALSAYLRAASDLPPGVIVLLILAAALMGAFVRRREVLGVQGNTGQAMLVDLRDQLRAQARPARLPAGVGMEVAQRSANGEGFSGDFVLSGVRPTADQRQDGAGPTDWPGALEVAVVDVSGKGQAAGTRALLLSGGLSGLMAGVRCEEFLSAANAYLLRQGWTEGFATALHVVLDPVTGHYSVRSAGHPGPVRHQVGSGRWTVVQTTPEPALGLLASVDYREVRGHLDHGDALVVFTDGVVEARGRDLAYGIDRLTGHLARHVRRGYAGAAEAVVDTLAVNDDDRTVVVLWRD